MIAFFSLQRPNYKNQQTNLLKVPEPVGCDITICSNQETPNLGLAGNKPWLGRRRKCPRMQLILLFYRAFTLSETCYQPALIRVLLKATP